MTSNPKQEAHDTFKPFFDYADDWKRMQEKADAPDADWWAVDMYHWFCKENYTHFSKEYLKYQKTWTQELCGTMVQTAKHEMERMAKKLATMQKPI